MNKMYFSNNGNKSTNARTYFDLLKNHIKSDTTYDLIGKKFDTIKSLNIPFRGNKSLNHVQRLENAKKSKISEVFFALEMLELEKEYKDVPGVKENTIYNLIVMLEKSFTAYEDAPFCMKELNFKHLYSIFLVLMDELKDTSYENNIKNYNFLFKNVFSFK